MDSVIEKLAEIEAAAEAIVEHAQEQKKVIERDIPSSLPKYFKRKRPTTIVANESFKGKRYGILLVEEGLGNDCWTRISPMARYFVRTADKEQFYDSEA